MKELLPILYVYVAVLLLVAFMMRPRRPWTVNRYANLQKIKIYLIVMLPIGAAMLWAGLSGLYHLDRILLVAGMFFCMGIMALGLVYVGYWSLPSLQEWKRNPKVRAAVERYRKPKRERLPREDLGEEWGWIPRLVVGGKFYYLVVYYLNSVSVKGGPPGSYIWGILALDGEGNVIRELELVNKLHRCRELAIKVCVPKENIKRAREYKKIPKAVGIYNRLLGQRENIKKSLAGSGQKVLEDLERVFQAFEVLRDSELTNKEFIRLEAEYAAEHGNIYMKECRYEDMLDLAARKREYITWVQGKGQAYLKGLEAANRLRAMLEEKKGAVPASRDLVDILLITLGSSKAGKALVESYQVPEINDTTVPIYFPMNDDEIRVWRERLAWVDEVDKRSA